MFAYVLRRLATTLLILAVLSVLIFAITQVMPGNVADILAGDFPQPEVVAAINQKLGLNEPVWLQYWRWASGVATGDLGQSLVMERPVAPMLLDALTASATLAVTAFVCVAVLGTLLGVLGAVRQNGLLDHAVSVVSYVGISVPEFFWGILLIIVFAEQLGWLPAGGRAEPSAGLAERISYLVLPAATLTMALIAHVARLTRSNMLETLRSQYVRNARAKGLPERVVVLRHALRNALLPTITVLAIDFGWLIGGIVVVEVVFSYPGFGRLLMFAIERHDLPLIQASVLVIATVYCLANLAADLLYAYVNPRIRYGRAAG